MRCRTVKFMTQRRFAFLLVVGLTLAVACGILASRITGGKDAHFLGTHTADMLIPAVYAACGSDETCIMKGVSEAANTDPSGAVDAVLAMFETPQAPRAGCHWAMHLLGQTLKPRTRAGEQLGLTGRWHVCGYAVLHGAFEDVPLEGDTRTIGRAAFDVCLNGVLEGPLVGQCFHAIGHTVEMNLPGVLGEPYLRGAEAACIEGAWHARTSMDTAAALKACVSGAHMRHRDNAVKPSGRLTVANGQEPSLVLPQCTNSLVPYACVTLYMEDAFAAGVSSAAEELLAWCAQTSPSATEVCGYFFGLAARGVPGRGAAEAINACTRNTNLTQGTQLACLRGVLERSSGEPLIDSPDTAYCQAVESLELGCAEIREFMPAYPDLTALNETLERTGRDSTD